MSCKASLTLDFLGLDGCGSFRLGVATGAGVSFFSSLGATSGTSTGFAGDNGFTGVSVGASEGSLIRSKTEGSPGEVLTTGAGSDEALEVSLSGTTTDLAAPEKDSDNRSDDFFVVSGGKGFSLGFAGAGGVFF